MIVKGDMPMVAYPLFYTFVYPLGNFAKRQLIECIGKCGYHS